jgi:hypothetical protein
LPLREHQHFGGQADSLGDRRNERERHESLEDRHLRRVDRRRSIVGFVTHDHVIEHRNIVVADGLDGVRELGDLGGAFAVRNARKVDGDLHDPTLARRTRPS